MPYKSMEERVKWNRERRRKFRKFINQKKSEIGGCQRCGYNKHPEILDFHHPDEKNFKINRKASCRSFKAIEVEIKLCELLCKNCHTEEHMDGWFNGKNQYSSA